LKLQFIITKFSSLIGTSLNETWVLLLIILLFYSSRYWILVQLGNSFSKLLLINIRLNLVLSCSGLQIFFLYTLGKFFDTLLGLSGFLELVPPTKWELQITHCGFGCHNFPLTLKSFNNQTYIIPLIKIVNDNTEQWFTYSDQFTALIHTFFSCFSNGWFRKLKKLILVVFL